MEYPITRSWDDEYYTTKSNRPNLYPFHIGIYNTILGPAHRHEYLEFSLVVQNEGVQMINGVHFPMLRGTCTFLLPHHIHKIIPVNSRIRIYNCRFDLDFLSRSTGTGDESGMEQLLLLQDDLPPTFQLPEDKVQMFEDMLEEMLVEYNEKEQLWKTHILQSMLTRLLIRFDRLRRLMNVSKPAGSGNHQTIWPIIHYISTNFDKSITQSQVAKHFYISSPYLSAAFKKHTGLNFVHFLHEVRIRHACSLLVSTEMNSMEIALEVGFTSSKSFARIFRSVKQITPMEYRKRHQKVVL